MEVVDVTFWVSVACSGLGLATTILCGSVSWLGVLDIPSQLNRAAACS